MKKQFILCVLAMLLLLVLPVLGCNSAAKVAIQHNDQGIALGEEGRYDEAITEFAKAIELNPNFAQAYSNRATAYMGKGEFDKSIVDCSKAI